MTTQRTYWHLESLRREPSDYEVTSSELLYYPSRGFELELPLEHWYERYQRGSQLRSTNWEGFADPRATTYTSYVAAMREKEIFVEDLLGSCDEAHDRALSADWLSRLEKLLPVLRFPTHGLQMLAAYVGQMAPSGKLLIVSAFQAADELRRIQVLAYRMRQLQRCRPGFGGASKRVWQSDPAWQPLRALIERMLVNYDFGEALVALNLVVKPLYDEHFQRGLGQLALSFGDRLLERVLEALHEDALWHREWSLALFRLLFQDRPENRGVVERWIGAHYPVALEALANTAPLFATDREQVAAALDRVGKGYLSALQVRVP